MSTNNCPKCGKHIARTRNVKRHLITCGQPTTKECSKCGRQIKKCNHKQHINACNGTPYIKPKKRIFIKPNTTTCNNCLKSYTYKTNQSEGKYCSLLCYQEYQWKQIVIDIIAGKGKSNSVKKYLLKTTSHICNKCKNTTWNNQQIPLELEHIDGNSENNNLSNVELLCPNCHAQTPTYKGKNRGNGRWKRRQRYASGVSY